jgi:putative aldouronate transport system substrate-binding protein
MSTGHKKVHLTHITKRGMKSMVNPKRGKAWGIVLLAFTIMVAGCSSQSQAPTEAKGGNTPAKVEKTKIDIMTVLYTTEVPSDRLEKLLEEKTNTELNFTFVPDGMYGEKVQAIMATGSLPQMLYVGNNNSFNNIRGYIHGDQFWEIGSYLKDYPNLSQLNPDILNTIKINGKLYSLYQETALTRQGIIYRKDWADQLGLSAPQSIDDIYNMLKKFKESGLSTIPLADRNDLVYGSFKTLSSYFGTPNNWGVIDGKLVPEFMTQGYVDTMKFVKKLRDEGLINQDFPVTSKTDQQNLMYSGKSGMYIGSMPDVNSMEDKTQANVKEAKYDVENKIVGVNGKLGIWSAPSYGSLLFPKSAIKTEADLKNILTFVDQLFDPEIANLFVYGLEGTHYTLKDGKVVPTGDAKLLEKEVSGYNGFTLDRITNIKPKYFPRPVAEKADQLTNEAIKFAITDPSNPLESKTNTEKGARLKEIIKDATYQFILGKIDEKGFQDAVKKWQDQGGKSIMEEFNASYKASNGR